MLKLMMMPTLQIKKGKTVDAEDAKTKIKLVEKD